MKTREVTDTFSLSHRLWTSLKEEESLVADFGGINIQPRGWILINRAIFYRGPGHTCMNVTVASLRVLVHGQSARARRQIKDFLPVANQIPVWLHMEISLVNSDLRYSLCIHKCVTGPEQWVFSTVSFCVPPPPTLALALWAKYFLEKDVIRLKSACLWYESQGWQNYCLYWLIADFPQYS